MGSQRMRRIMLTNLNKFPAPYYGGKTDAAPFVWEALGDPAHYVEPMCGSCATLLLRPHPCNRTYYSETVNDADGLLVNALRGIQMQPDATAGAASVNVAEAELMSRHLALMRFKAEHDLEKLLANPEWCDPVVAGWWLWGLSSWIGSGWCGGDGPWIVGADGRITKQSKSNGVSRQLPHLGNDGRGVNRPQAREPGVSRQLPHLGDNGRGVNHAGAREPGVAEDNEFHPQTMPELRRWFQFLSARLRHVRILNGDWKRSVTRGASITLPCRQGKGVCGVFFDPPYSTEAERAMGLYVQDSGDVAHDVRAWCLKNGCDKRYRIVLAGFVGEGHEKLESNGWRVIEWFKAGFLKGGMGNTGEKDEDGETHQQARERLWLSPHCCMGDAGLFDDL